VHDRRQLAFGITQRRQQTFDPSQGQIDQFRMKF
jgi:hypothetical protein